MGIKAKRKGKDSEDVNGEGTTVRQLATRIPTDTYKRLKLFAVTNDVSISTFVTECLNNALAKTKAKAA